VDHYHFPRFDKIANVEQKQDLVDFMFRIRVDFTIYITNNLFNSYLHFMHGVNILF